MVSKKDDVMNVSVCMATHNGERFLRPQIDSILLQLGPSDELVISDDNSTDGTPGILASYHDPHLRVLSPRSFGDPVRNFEYAMANARNQFIFLADQDDVWHQQKIAIMKDRLLTSADLVVCDCRLTNQQLETVTPSFFKTNRSGPGLLRNLFKSSYMGCCMAFRREVMEKAFPLPELFLHDQWIGLVAERHFRIAFIPQILVDHRRHLANYSSTGAQSRNSLKKKLRLRFQLILQLLIH